MQEYGLLRRDAWVSQVVAGCEVLEGEMTGWTRAQRSVEVQGTGFCLD